MDDLESHRRAVAERLLEDDSLTADLLDPAAKVLLDWGVARAEALAGQAEELDARLADLRRTLKRIARQAGQEATPETQVERVQGLLAEVEAATTPVSTAEAVTTNSTAIPVLTTKVVTTSSTTNRRRGRKCTSR